MTLPQAGASLLMFWQREQRLYDASARPYSSVADLLEGDPYLKCAKGAGPSGKALLVELDVAALARDAAAAAAAAPPPPPPPFTFGQLLSAIDAALPDQEGPGLVANWLAKLLASEANPGLSAWDAAGAAASGDGDAYSLPLLDAEHLLRSAWAHSGADAGPFPAHDIATLVRTPAAAAGGAAAPGGAQLLAVRRGPGRGPRVQLELTPLLAAGWG